MSKVFITGDTHGPVEASKLSNRQHPGFRETTREDIVAITGDFGFYFDDRKESLWWRNWLTERSYTVVFVDGNHENFPMMEDRSTKVQKFGGECSQLADNIFWLRRGNIYNLNGYKTFAFGGAESTDRQWRIDGVSWWKEELPTIHDFNRGWETLEANDWSVDMVLSHTCPSRVMNALYGSDRYYNGGNFGDKRNDPTCIMLQEFYEKLKFQSWWFGHHHIDRRFEFDNRFWATYDKIYKLPEKENI